MSSNLQSIVCCLGDPVAGNPTQFLMQRAAGLLEMDWMFVTAEVPEARLVEAFRGIRALRFSGVAFLSPHQKAAIELVDSLTESAIRSGHVRVARRDGDAWLGDDTLGMAIVELLANDHINAHSGSSKPAVILAKSMGTDQLQSLPRGLLCTGNNWMPHLVRLARPDWTSKIFQWDATSDTASNIISDQVWGENGSPLSSNDLQSTSTSSNGESTLKRNFGIFIIENCSPSITSKQLARMVHGEDEVTAVFVHHNASWEFAIQNLGIPRKRIYRSFDIAAAKAAVNFQFWTGQTPEFVSIRDSLEEYCQW